MVVVVTGAKGQLGLVLQSIASNYPEIQFYFFSSLELDITNKLSIETIFFKYKPNYCINAAAYTAVDKAESDLENAYLINAKGPENLSQICKKFATTLIHISTDFVFEGNNTIPYTEDDKTNPQGIYGKSKRDGELAIINSLKEYFIIRTSWLYSGFGNNFMKTMLRLAQEKDSLRVVDDQIGSPTCAIDLAEIIIKIIKSNSRNFGIYNYSNEGKASWYDFAKKIFEINNVPINLFPIPSDDFPTPAKRPKYSVLDKTKIKFEFKIEINNWEESLRKCK